MQYRKQEKYERIERFIDDYSECYGGSPCVREISAGTGIPKTTVSEYLRDMKEKGVLQFEGHRNIVTRRAMGRSLHSVEVPLLGAVSCGIPKFAEENIEEYLVFPDSFLGHGTFYLLRANGDSMIDAGIEDRDLVLIRQQNTASRGQIVVALMEDEATLKRFYPEPEHHRIRLHPENEALEDIYVDHCEIQGIAVKVIKDL